jgi:muconolactone delta-isomerase
MKYLVFGTGGPGFASQEEAVQVLKELVLPSFDALMKLEKQKKILAGGLPVGERALVFIAEAESNDELDSMLRDLPLWNLLEWEVTPLQSFGGRSSKELGVVKGFKKKK